MKNIFKILFLLSTVTAFTYSQNSDWEYIGIYKDNDVYYLKSSVKRDKYLMLIGVLKPQVQKNDENGTPYKYMSYMLTFHKDYRNQVRCVISNRIMYFDDKTYKQIDMPKLDVAIESLKILMDIYNKLRQ